MRLRLRAWLSELFAAKRRKAGEDPELFATYFALADEHSEVVERHVDTMVGHLAKIINDGVAARSFADTNVSVAARAVWHATCRYHDPVYAAEWSAPGVPDDFTAVCDLVLLGLGG